ncbi:hypothetical protein C0993_006025, partial [Termitomyces sp. T159_Od127]
MDIQAQDDERQRALDEIHNILEDSNTLDYNNANWADIDEVIEGQASINLSHAGGEFQELFEEELQPQRKQRDYHPRQDAIVWWNLGFATQLDRMVSAYLRWSKACGVSGQAVAAPFNNDAVVQEVLAVKAVDLFETYSCDIPMLQGGETIAMSGVLQEMLPTERYSEEGTVGSESNLCADQWKNMIDELTAHMWGIFNETGVFLALCQHSFVLLIVDMIQSGELSLGLHTFLVNNYKQAIKLINSLPALEKQMKDQGMASFKTFKQWLVKEKIYLAGLSQEPVEETLQMEYYQKL